MNDLTSFPEPLRNLINSKLEPGETVVWASQVDMATDVKSMRMGIYVRRGLFIFFALLPLPIVFIKPVVGVPIFLALLALNYFAWGSMRGLEEEAKRKGCVITNRRAISANANGRTWVSVYTPEQWKSLTVNERKDGSGDVIFFQTSQKVGESTSVSYHGLLNIPNVREAEKHLRAVAG
jgi:hypothetical protein